jgi:hypothetical protein
MKGSFESYCFYENVRRYWADFETDGNHSKVAVISSIVPFLEQIGKMNYSGWSFSFNGWIFAILFLIIWKNC